MSRRRSALSLGGVGQFVELIEDQSVGVAPFRRNDVSYSAREEVGPRQLSRIGGGDARAERPKRVRRRLLDVAVCVDGNAAGGAPLVPPQLFVYGLLAGWGLC